MRTEMDVYYGCRIIVVLFVWCSLGFTFYFTTNHQVVFSSMVIYLLPLSLDYYVQTPFLLGNKKRQLIGFWTSLFSAALFCVLGLLSGSFDISHFVTHWASLWVFWLLSGFFFILSIKDWIAYSSPYEMEHRSKLRELHIKETKGVSMGARTNNYKRKKK